MKSDDGKKLMECLDELEVRGLNLQTLAQLLLLCGEMGSRAVVDAETVGRTGYLITQELKQMNAALEGLREEIRREE